LKAADANGTFAKIGDSYLKSEADGKFALQSSLSSYVITAGSNLNKNGNTIGLNADISVGSVNAAGLCAWGGWKALGQSANLFWNVYRPGYGNAELVCHAGLGEGGWRFYNAWGNTGTGYIEQFAINDFGAYHRGSKLALESWVDTTYASKSSLSSYVTTSSLSTTLGGYSTVGTSYSKAESDGRYLQPSVLSNYAQSANVFSRTESDSRYILQNTISIEIGNPANPMVAWLDLVSANVDYALRFISWSPTDNRIQTISGGNLSIETTDLRLNGERVSMGHAEVFFHKQSYSSQQGLHIGWNRDPTWAGDALFVINKGGGSGFYRFARCDFGSNVIQDLFTVTDDGCYYFSNKLATESWVGNQGFWKNTNEQKNSLLLNDNLEVGRSYVQDQSSLNHQIQIRCLPFTAASKIGGSLLFTFQAPVYAPGMQIYCHDQENQHILFGTEFYDNKFIAGSPRPASICKQSNDLCFYYASPFWQNGAGNRQQIMQLNAGLKMSLIDGLVTCPKGLKVYNTNFNVDSLEVNREGNGSRWSALDLHNRGTPGQFDYNATFRLEPGAEGNLIIAKNGGGRIIYDHQGGYQTFIGGGYGYLDTQFAHHFRQSVSVKGALFSLGYETFTATGYGAAGFRVQVPADDPFNPNGYSEWWTRLSRNQQVEFRISLFAAESIVTAHSVFAISDEREKIEIEDIPESVALYTLENINPKRFEKVANPGRKQLGFIAQDVARCILEPVMPYNDRLHLDHAQLTPILWKCVQTLKRRVDHLEKMLGNNKSWRKKLKRFSKGCKTC